MGRPCSEARLGVDVGDAYEDGVFEVGESKSLALSRCLSPDDEDDAFRCTYVDPCVGEGCIAWPSLSDKRFSASVHSVHGCKWVSLMWPQPPCWVKLWWHIVY
jgi:hypothetical protein